MDLLVLADPNGVVNMTDTAIAARTRIPLPTVNDFLHRLMAPDARSQSPEADGRRIELIDEHRPWGWHIINYSKYREIATEEQRRASTRERVARFKLNRKALGAGNAPVTPANAGNAMQKQKERDKNNEQVPPTPKGFDEFWEAYPRKIGRMAALKAWSKSKCSEHTPKILEAIAKQKETHQWKKDGGQFIPHPSTWINQGRWDDVPLPEPEHRFF